MAQGDAGAGNWGEFLLKRSLDIFKQGLLKNF